MKVKSPVKSKRIWFNTLSVIGIALTNLMATSEFKDEISGYVVYFMIAGALINAWLTLTSPEVIIWDRPANNEHDIPPPKIDDEYLKDF